MRCVVVVSAEDSGSVVFWIVVAGVFVVAAVDACVVEVSSLLFGIPVIAGVLTRDTIVATVVSLELLLPATTGNVLVSAIDSTVVGILGRMVECAMVLATIPTGVAVTSAILFAAVVAVAIVARAAVVSAVVTGHVDDLSAVVSDSAVVKCFGVMLAVVVGVVDVG